MRCGDVCVCILSSMPNRVVMDERNWSKYEDTKWLRDCYFMTSIPLILWAANIIMQLSVLAEVLIINLIHNYLQQYMISYKTIKKCQHSGHSLKTYFLVESDFQNWFCLLCMMDLCKVVVDNHAEEDYRKLNRTKQFTRYFRLNANTFQHNGIP